MLQNYISQQFALHEARSGTQLMLHKTYKVRLLCHNSCVWIAALGHLTSCQSCLGSGLWATLNFVTFCPD